MTTSIARTHVHYSGSVQGVGFRWRVCRVAEEFAVTGFVRNLADGRVELVAEGDLDDVQTFVASVAERLDRHIRQQVVDWPDATGEFGDFGVRR